MKNKYVEAFENIKFELKNNVFGENLNKDIDALQQLVERATPKKIKDVCDSEDGLCKYGKCPNCNCFVGVNNQINYCDTCGQALRYEDEKMEL